MLRGQSPHALQMSAATIESRCARKKRITHNLSGASRALYTEFTTHLLSMRLALHLLALWRLAAAAAAIVLILLAAVLHHGELDEHHAE